jgi:hypothetical protein
MDVAASGGRSAAAKRNGRLIRFWRDKTKQGGFSAALFRVDFRRCIASPRGCIAGNPASVPRGGRVLDGGDERDGAGFGGGEGIPGGKFDDAMMERVWTATSGHADERLESEILGVVDGAVSPVRPLRRRSV